MGEKEIINKFDLKVFEVEENITIQEFIEKYLLKEYPLLEPKLSAYLISVNQQYIEKQNYNEQLLNNCEFAVIPPVSGG